MWETSVTIIFFFSTQSIWKRQIHVVFLLSTRRSAEDNGENHPIDNRLVLFTKCPSLSMDFILSLRLECERTKERERKTHEEREEICPGRPRCSCSIVRSFVSGFFLVVFLYYIHQISYDWNKRKKRKRRRRRTGLSLLKLCSFTVIAMTNEEETFQKGLKQKKSITWHIFVSIGEQSKETMKKFERRNGEKTYGIVRLPILFVLSRDVRDQWILNERRERVASRVSRRGVVHPDWDRKGVNKSIVELWRLSVPVTSYFAECPDRWHRWNWCSGDKFSL